MLAHTYFHVCLGYLTSVAGIAASQFLPFHKWGSRGLTLEMIMSIEFIDEIVCCEGMRGTPIMEKGQKE